jgi:hypothetical protein
MAITSFGCFALPYQSFMAVSTQKEGGVPLIEAAVQNLPDDSFAGTGKTGCPPRKDIGKKTGRQKAAITGTSTAGPAGPRKKARNQF